MNVRRAALIPILVLLVAAARPSAQPPETSPVPGPWRVGIAQGVLGFFGGSMTGILGGVAGYLLVPPCVNHHGGFLGESAASAIAGRPCGDYGLLAGLALGAVAGTSGGIYAVGRNNGNRGSFLATAGGTAAGLAAGITLARLARPQGEVAFALVAGTALLSGVGAYHLSDRLRAQASLAPPARPGDGPGAGFQLEWALP